MYCNDDCCAGDDEAINTLVNLGSVVQGISVQLDDSGFPSISFFSGSVLQVARCSTPSCDGFVGIETVDSDSPTGQYTSLQFCGFFDQPIVSYYSPKNADLMISCLINPSELSSQPSLSLQPSPVPSCPNNIVDNFTSTDVGKYTSLACAPDTQFPVITYQDVTNENLQLVLCGDSLCTSDNLYETLDESGVGFSNSLALDSDGNPYISYLDLTNLFVKFYSSPGGAVNITAASVVQDADTSLALDSNGLPIITFQDSSLSLSIIYCAAVNCFDTTIVQLDGDPDVGLYNSLQLNSVTQVPVVAYFDNTLKNLLLLKCGDVNCTSPPMIENPDPGSKFMLHPGNTKPAHMPVTAHYLYTSPDLSANIMCLFCIVYFS